MLGGTEKAIDSVKELLATYTQEVQHFGPAGAGQHTKMANQIQVASTMVGLCESLLYAQKAGLNHEQMIRLLQKGAARSFLLESLGP